MRVAATEKGEADRILKVKHAQGEAESKALQGRGIADQRQAIIAGLRDSVDEFRRSVPGTTAKDVMNLVLMTQYFDMLKDIGASSRTNAILIPHSPGNLASLTEQMRNAMIEADQTVRAPDMRTPYLPELSVVSDDGHGTLDSTQRNRPTALVGS
jgi:regulator of protease activity HflC (stomatin/prohibitin superfamily)